MTTDVKEKATTIAPFGIQVDHPRNADLLLQSIKNCRLRSAISSTRTVTDKRSGHTMVPASQAAMATFPSTPGMKLYVKPSDCSYKIIDPLCENEELCNRILRYLKEKGMAGSSTKIAGVPESKGTLDPHYMKTLVRELFQLSEAGHVKECMGHIPKLKDIDAMPGKYLLNPGSTVLNGQPRFEEDFDMWHTRLTMTG